MSGREPWAVRLYRRAAWTVGDLSTDAADAFASLYADERRRGLPAAMRLWLRAMIDLVRAGAIVTRPRPFAAFGHDVRWAWRTLRTRPGVSLVVIASIGLAIGANTAAFSVVNAFLWRSWGSAGDRRSRPRARRLRGARAAARRARLHDGELRSVAARQHGVRCDGGRYGNERDARRRWPSGTRGRGCGYRELFRRPRHPSGARADLHRRRRYAGEARRRAARGRALARPLRRRPRRRRPHGPAERTRAHDRRRDAARPEASVSIRSLGAARLPRGPDEHDGHLRARPPEAGRHARAGKRGDGRHGSAAVAGASDAPTRRPERR